MFRKISLGREREYSQADLKNKQKNAFQKSLRHDGLPTRI